MEEPNVSRRGGTSGPRWFKDVAYAVELVLLCPAELHEVAFLSRQIASDAPLPAGRQRTPAGQPTGHWSDGVGQELLQRAGCLVTADDEVSAPRKITVRCGICERKGDRRSPQRSWASLLKLLDAVAADADVGTRRTARVRVALQD